MRKASDLVSQVSELELQETQPEAYVILETCFSKLARPAMHSLLQAYMSFLPTKEARLPTFT